MLVKNIFTRMEFETQENPKLCNKVKRNQEPLTNITNEIFSRGDKTVSIKNQTYNIREWDSVIIGHTARLFQTQSGVLVVVNVLPTPDIHLIHPINEKNDTNVTQYRFSAYTDYDDSHFKSKVLEAYLLKDETIMQQSRQITEKVVGTSFYEHKDISEFEGENQQAVDVPTLVGTAIIMPEPDNPYDSRALAVIAKLSNGRPHKIGHIGRNSEIYNTVTSPTPAVLKIHGYSLVGNYNDSYEITMTLTKLQ